MAKKLEKIISEYMRQLGRKGTGASKIRGDREYYSRIAKMRKKPGQQKTCKTDSDVV